MLRATDKGKIISLQNKKVWKIETCATLEADIFRLDRYFFVAIFRQRCQHFGEKKGSKNFYSPLKSKLRLRPKSLNNALFCRAKRRLCVWVKAKCYHVHCTLFIWKRIILPFAFFILQFKMCCMLLIKVKSSGYKSKKYKKFETCANLEGDIFRLD